jgi:NADH:ubiquinone oxidoreductase subunit 3 (subunit A)
MYLLLLAPIIAGVLLALSYFIRELTADLAKGAPFECGFVPSYGQAYSPFAVAFFFVGLLFLLFDLELLFMFPLTYGLDLHAS